MRLAVRIPPNTRATVELPVARAAGVTLDGAALTGATESGGRTALTLPSGDYAFDLPAPNTP